MASNLWIFQPSPVNNKARRRLPRRQMPIRHPPAKISGMRLIVRVRFTLSAAIFLLVAVLCFLHTFQPLWPNATLCGFSTRNQPSVEPRTSVHGFQQRFLHSFPPVVEGCRALEFGVDFTRNVLSSSWKTVAASASKQRRLWTRPVSKIKIVTIHP